MSDAVDRFDEIADEYDDFTGKIARYREMIETCLEVLEAFDRVRPPRSVVDLGCGTGRLGRLIVKEFSPEHYRGVDGAAGMIRRARQRFEEYGGATEVQFSRDRFEEWQPSRPYDWVVSSLAIHHLEADGKRRLFDRIRGTLRERGWFLLCDLVRPPTKLRSLYRSIARHRMLRRGFSEEEFEQRWESHLENDRPSSVDEHLEWFREVGFERTDCVWKDMNRAILIGQRPRD